MREVAILGGGTTVFGKFPEKSIEELGREAVLAAVSDAGIKVRDIEFGCCATVYGGFCVGQRIFKEAGISRIEVLNVENAWSGGNFYTIKLRLHLQFLQGNRRARYESRFVYVPERKP